MPLNFNQWISKSTNQLTNWPNNQHKLIMQILILVIKWDRGLHSSVDQSINQSIKKLLNHHVLKEDRVRFQNVEKNIYIVFIIELHKNHSRIRLSIVIGPIPDKDGHLAFVVNDSVVFKLSHAERANYVFLV